MKHETRNTIIQTNQRGFVALLSVLVVSAVGVAIGVSLMLLGIGNSKSSLALEQSTQAKSFANACSEEALQKIRESTAFSGTATINFTEGSCTYTVTTGSGQNRTITTSATVGTIVRKTSISITQITPTITISSWQEIP